MNNKPIATLAAMVSAAALLMAPALTQAATATKEGAAAKSKVKAKSDKAKTGKTAEQLASQRSSTSSLVPGAGQAGLTPAELAIAERVHVGHLPCELGASVTLSADPGTPGYFNLQGKSFSYRMFPVQTTTGAVRLEDPKAGVVWLQLATKSMLMNQKQGTRLADECISPVQLAMAQSLKSQPAVTPFEPARPAAVAPVQVAPVAAAPVPGAAVATAPVAVAPIAAVPVAAAPVAAAPVPVAPAPVDPLMQLVPAEAQ